MVSPRWTALNGFNQRKLELAIDHLKRKVCQVTLPGTTNKTTATIVENPSSSSTPSTSLLWKNLINSMKYVKLQLIQQQLELSNWTGIYRSHL